MNFQSILIGILSGVIAAELHYHRLKINHYIHMFLIRHEPKERAEILRDAVMTLYLEPWKSEFALHRIVRLMDPDLSELLQEDPEAAAEMVNPEIAADKAKERDRKSA